VAPSVKTALIDERDEYMASHIGEQRDRGGGLVAVVGAGHLPGIKARLLGNAPPPERRKELDLPPPPKLTVGKVIGWLIPLAIVAFFVYLAVTGRFTELRDQALAFVLITGGLSALGCALALGHPVAILVAFVAAPIGVLHPLLATGWFSGLAQAWVRKPTVADFEAIKRIQTFKGFWTNGVVRILLVAALTNVGAMVSTAIVIPRFFQALAGG
jgi:pheromone shutdown-related protein TraB